MKNKDWIIVGGIIVFFLWRNQAMQAATMAGSAGNPSPVVSPVVAPIQSAGNVTTFPVLKPILSPTLGAGAGNGESSNGILLAPSGNLNVYDD